MLRQLHIAITTVLVAMHAIVVPWHVVSSPGLLHAHAAEVQHVDDAHHEHDADGPAGWFAACGTGAPHQHGVHAHSATDHVYSRSRAQELPTPSVVLPSLVEQLPQPSAPLSAEAADSSRPKAPCLAISFLRGPPVC